MSTVVFCCNTLRDEVQKIIKVIGLNYPTVYLEGGFHNHPERMRSHINEILARETRGFDRALMAMGHCGGVCRELDPIGCELIIPRADDCLSLLMGSMKRRQKASRQIATYFLTAGWLRHTENLITSFERDCELFGSKQARVIYRIMLKHYRRFGFIDTGTYDLELEKKKTAPLSSILNIQTESLAGDLSWLRRLLTGPWNPDEFLVLAPGKRLDQSLWNWEICQPR